MTFDPLPLRWTCMRSRTRSPPYSKRSPAYASPLVRHSMKPVSNASEYSTWLPLARAKLRTPASPVPCPRAYRYLCQYAAFDTCSTIASPVRWEAHLTGACTFVGDLAGLGLPSSGPFSLLFSPPAIVPATAIAPVSTTSRDERH